MEQHSGDQDIIAAGFAGASGDIDPWYRVLPGFRTDNGWLPETCLMATMLGEEIATVSQGVSAAQQHGPICTEMRSVDLPGKASQVGTANPNMNVAVGRVGDIAIVGFGGEVFNGIGQNIKGRSPFRHTFIITHCNGAAGYLPTSDSYGAGGYEVQSAQFGAGAAEKLESETLRLLRLIKERQ